LRRGEAFKLAWADVDIAKGALTVQAQNATSGKQRIVPLNQIALATLWAWQSQTQGDELVFPSPQTGGKLDNVQTAWQNICRDAGVKGLRLHDSRHTFATRALAAGADIAVVQELLGHADIATTAIYLHPNEQDKRRAVERLAVSGEDIVALRQGTA
jgi:integrase